MIQLVITIFILLVVIYSLVRGVNHYLLTIILLVTGINVLLSEILRQIDPNANIKWNTNLYFIINNILWIQIIIEYFHKKSKLLLNTFLLGLLVYTVINENIIDKVYYTFFVVTSLIYIALFLILSIKNLNNEKLDFFQSTELVLLFAPVLFFLGMSFIFGFKSTVFSKTYLFKDVNIYVFINLTVNVIYYLMIGYYAYKYSKQ